MYTKLAASCLKLPNAVGLYSSGTVFQPELFVEMAETMKSDDLFPLLNLVYFGLCSHGIRSQWLYLWTQSLW